MRKVSIDKPISRINCTSKCVVHYYHGFKETEIIQISDIKGTNMATSLEISLQGDLLCVGPHIQNQCFIFLGQEK